MRRISISCSLSSFFLHAQNSCMRGLLLNDRIAFSRSCLRNSSMISFNYNHVWFFKRGPLALDWFCRIRRTALDSLLISNARTEAKSCDRDEWRVFQSTFTYIYIYINRCVRQKPLRYWQQHPGISSSSRRHREREKERETSVTEKFHWKSEAGLLRLSSRAHLVSRNLIRR